MALLKNLGVVQDIFLEHFVLPLHIIQIQMYNFQKKTKYFLFLWYYS